MGRTKGSRNKPKQGVVQEVEQGEGVPYSTSTSTANVELERCSPNPEGEVRSPGVEPGPVVRVARKKVETVDRDAVGVKVLGGRLSPSSCPLRMPAKCKMFKDYCDNCENRVGCVAWG